MLTHPVLHLIHHFVTQPKWLKTIRLMPRSFGEKAPGVVLFGHRRAACAAAHRAAALFSSSHETVTLRVYTGVFQFN
jgi:hypothetical protein